MNENKFTFKLIKAMYRLHGNKRYIFHINVLVAGYEIVIHDVNTKLTVSIPFTYDAKVQSCEVQNSILFSIQNKLDVDEVAVHITSIWFNMVNKKGTVNLSLTNLTIEEAENVLSALNVLEPSDLD